MKNTKELEPILVSIYCLNRTQQQPNQDIENIISYAFNRIFNANTNLITLACIGKSQEEVRAAIMQILSKETKFDDYIKFKNNLYKKEKQ